MPIKEVSPATLPEGGRAGQADGLAPGGEPLLSDRADTSIPMGEVRVSNHRERGSEISFEIFGLGESQTRAAASGAPPKEALQALGTHLAKGNGLGSLGWLSKRSQLSHREHDFAAQSCANQLSTYGVTQVGCPVPPLR